MGHCFKKALRTAGKNGFFHVYLAVRPALRSIRLLHREQQIVVLAYHRVNDEIRDVLTVSIEQFRTQMCLIRKNYPVIRIEQIMKGELPRPSSNRPLIAVTFDDGYRDNYINALPLLREFEIPATFFISTGMIGRNKPFPHDIKRLGRALPHMTWEQIRHLHALGFGIGSHTVNHIDCGCADEELLRVELQQSLLAIRSEVGVTTAALAFPYGQPENFSPLAQTIAKEVGYIGCCSAFGGVNSSIHIEPFNIKRQAIHHDFNSLSFLARLEGYH